MTWTSVLSSPYNTNYETVDESATLTVNNPCADSSIVTITASDVTPQSYILYQGDKNFNQPADISVTSPYDTVCGDLSYSVKYGDPLTALAAADPLSYVSATGVFTINSEDTNLIDVTEDYELFIQFADY